MTDDIVLQFDPPADPVSMNDGDTWGTRADAAAWRDRAFFAWCEMFPGKGPSGRQAPCPATVTVLLPFPTHRRRDPINFARTVKHIVDGFQMAGAWPDDTLEYVTQNIPTLLVRRGAPVLVRVSPRTVDPFQQQPDDATDDPVPDREHGDGDS